MQTASNFKNFKPTKTLHPKQKQHPTMSHLDFSTRRPWHHFSNFAEIDTSCQVHLAGMNFQNIQTGLRKIIKRLK